MRSLPRISLTTHGLLELVAGLALTVAALVLDLGGAGTVLVFATGVALAGVGLGTADALPINVHQSLDRTLVVVFAGAAVGCAFAGAGLAAVILLVTAGSVLLLEAGTRWSRPLPR
jgi:hypothetical protein